MRIAVVYSEGDLNGNFPDDSEGRFGSQNSVDVIDVLDSSSHDVQKIPADGSLINSLLKDAGKIDLVFNTADEGVNLNTQLEPHIPALLEMLGLKYTGSDHLCLASCLDKVRTKQVLLANGLPTPKFKVFSQKISEKEDLSGLSFPLIVKPSKQDGSIGIREDSVVETGKELIKKVNDVLKAYNAPALVEEFIDGREIYVGILGNNRPSVLPMTEIDFSLHNSKRRMLPYEAKWLEDSDYFKGTGVMCPANVEPALKEKISELAKKAYMALGVKNYGRIDFRVDNSGNPYILEVNPNPNLCKGEGISLMAGKMGMSYPEFIEKIMHLAANGD